MKKKILFIFTILICMSISISAQEDETLCKLTRIVEGLRLKTPNKTKYNAAVSQMFDLDKKITLLDDMQTTNKKMEYSGTDMNKFRLNSVVTNVYKKQSGVNLSKGDYNDSRQNGIYYSLIEKSIKAGCTADFTITEHKGYQEIVVLPFSNASLCNIHVTCDGKEAKSTTKNGRYVFSIDNVTPADVIHVIIKNNAKTFQSFAILNYNKKK